MAVIANLRALNPAVQFTGICPDPGDAARSLGIPAFPLDGQGPGAAPEDFGSGPTSGTDYRPTGGSATARWRRLRRMSDCVRSLDLLLVSGGGQLDDFWGGPWGHPFAMFAWSLLARLHGVRVAFVGVGMDRLSAPMSRFFAMSALRLAHYRAFRDSQTLAALESMGLRARSHLCADLAFSLRLSEASPPAPSSSDPCIVVNPISADTWARGGDQRHGLYLRNLADACEWLLQRGFRIRVVCSQGAMDLPVASDLLRMIGPRSPSRVELLETPRVQDYIAQVGVARVVIASRLHGAILSLIAGTPVVAVSPLPKVAKLMDDVGLSDYRVNLQDFDSADLIQRIGAALDRYPSLRQRVRERTQEFRSRLNQTYAEILALADSTDTGRCDQRPAELH